MKRQKLMTGIAALFVVGLVAGPATAEWSTGKEYEVRNDLECRADRQYPPDQDAPSGSQCAATHNGTWNPDQNNGQTEKYTGRKWDNQVRCDASQVPDPVPVKVYGGGDPGAMWGGAGICQDGDTVPIRGRIVAGGSFEHEGFYVYADGDERNQPEQAQGWLRADATMGEQGAGCGSEGNARERDASADGTGTYAPGNCG